MNSMRMALSLFGRMLIRFLFFRDNITKAFVVQAFQYSAPFLMQMPQPDDFLARLFPLAYRSSETDLGVMVFVLEILSALAPIVWHRPKALFFVMSPVRDMAAKGTSQSITTSWYFWKAWATCCGKFLDLARSCNVKGSFGAESEPLRSKIVVSELSKALNYLSKHSSALPIDLIKELT